MEDSRDPIEGPAYNPFQHPLVWCLQDFLAQRNSSCSGDVSLLGMYSMLNLELYEGPLTDAMTCCRGAPKWLLLAWRTALFATSSMLLH
jgi:hypothetical protein